MVELRRYRNFVYDSARWAGFTLRPGDVVVSTPPKCGTTWTQTLCAFLVHDTTELDRPLTELAPWLDQQTEALGSVVARLDAQQHRRIIKTHTPLDGLPHDERVTYLCVGRDPRDVAISWAHHWDNMDLDALTAARAAAVGLDDLVELGPPPPPPPEDPKERFWQWAQDTAPAPSMNLVSLLGQLAVSWERRDDPGVHLFHYGDLQADLVGEARRLADVLAIEVGDARLAELAAAAGFERMRARAEVTAPNSTTGFWRSTEDFFHRGTSGQWRELLDADDLRRYERRVAELAPPDLLAWAHGGWAAVPDPAPLADATPS